MKVWLLIEEAEAGSFAGGGTYSIEAAYLSAEKADDARDAWRAEHEDEDEGCGWSRDDDADWCPCGAGVTVAEVEAQ